MAHPTHRPRTLRNTVLAFLAVAGVAASGGGAAGSALLAGHAPIVPGRAALTAGGHVETAALGSGLSAARLLAEAGERPQWRGGPDRDARQPTAPRAAPGAVPPAEHAGVDVHPFALLAHRRAGLDTAPATGPPSLPF